MEEAVETAQDVIEYETDEDEKVTAAVIKKALKDLINDLKGNTSDSARRELKNLQVQEKQITALETRIKTSKTALKALVDELGLKIQLKRLGGEGFKAESQELIRQVEGQLASLDPHNKDDKKKISALNKDKSALDARLSRTDHILNSIGGALTEEEARQLILQKLYDVAHDELNRYLNAEKRGLIQIAENLWDKYAVSSREMEHERSETLAVLDGFLRGVGYLA